MMAASLTEERERQIEERVRVAVVLMLKHRYSTAIARQQTRSLSLSLSVAHALSSLSPIPPAQRDHACLHRHGLELRAVHVLSAAGQLFEVHIREVHLPSASIDHYFFNIH